MLTASLGFVAESVSAQTAPDDDLGDLPTLQQEFLDTAYGVSGSFFRSQGLWGTLSVLIGPFPENTIITDGRGINSLYEEALELQTSSDPTIRTADLTNPFDTSLLLLPPSQTLRPAPAPAFVPPAYTPPVPPAPAAPATAPASPVRGLY